MNDQEFDRVSEILFNGVPSIARVGVPGNLIPLSSDTRAVLCGETSTNVLVVAVRLGQGRCLVFGHNGYVGFFENPANAKNDGQFINNCKQWVANGSTNEILSLNSVNSLNDVDVNGKILVWDGHRDKSGEFMNDLLEVVYAGGALVCGCTAWGWAQLNGNKPLSAFPFSQFCSTIGVKLTKNYFGSPDPIPYRTDLIQFKNIQNIIGELNRNPNAKEFYLIVGAAVKELEGSPSDLPTEMLESMVANATEDVIPVRTCPVKDPKCREQSQGLCYMLARLPGIKAPGVDQFPGDFKEPPQFESDVLCTVEASAREWFCTGYYVAAGTTVQIDIIESQGANGWSARIGCHSDDIRGSQEYRRWNCISITKTLTEQSTELCSAFGGLLFLESPEGNSSMITVNISRVVLAPCYHIADENRVESWTFQRENAQGLWADIAGNYIVFNVPSTSIREIGSEQLDRALNYWDKVVLAHHELLGTQPTHRERIVCDEQPSAGYMHSGYPIVTHLDVSDPKGKYFVFNTETLEAEGSWGLFHELGHNRQNPAWTFNGTSEVTVNIFTLHAMEVLSNIKPWIHPWLQGQMTGTQQHLSSGADFEKWKQQAGIALFIYAQLVHEFGWDAYKSVFRTYEQTKPKLNSDQEKIDHWIITFSEQVGKNLVPLFKFWSFPVSQSTVDRLAKLPVHPMNDEIIQQAPDRYKA